MDIQGIKDSADSNRENSIGKWSASIKMGRKVILVVHGVIPTNVDKKSFTLTLGDQQRTDPSILVLDVSPDVAALGGSSEVEVYYSEILDRCDQYKSVLIKGNGRQLALFGIKES